MFAPSSSETATPSDVCCNIMVSTAPTFPTVNKDGFICGTVSAAFCEELEEAAGELVADATGEAGLENVMLLSAGEEAIETV